MTTEIYINNTLVDAYEDYNISLNFAIADIKTPDKRNTSYSKTIKLPGSKTNNQLFTYIFDVSKEALDSGIGTNFAPDFNPNKKAACQIYTDGLLQLTGYVQLLDVRILNDSISYEVAVSGVLANLLTDVEGKKLTDLDFSEYDHYLTKVNQKESWDTRIQKNGANYVNFAGGQPIGEGYVYPIIDYGYDQTLNRFNVVRLFPAIYLKTYIDKIFEYAGFSYTSDFFNSQFFKNLIIPFSGEVVKISETDRESRKFISDYNADEVYSNLGAGLESYYFTFPDESLDPSGVYFPGVQPSNIAINAGYYEPDKTGTYNLNVALKATITGSFLNYFALYYRIYDSSGVEIDTQIVLGPLTSFSDIVIDNVYTLPSYGLQKDWKVRVFASYRGVFTVQADTAFYNNPVANPVNEGDFLQLNGAVPREVPIKDFFMSIVRKYNLYVNPDPDNEKNLFIEPAKDFYSGNSVVDWTNKLDLSREIEIKPVSEIEGKNYVFSYKEDKDYYNTDYKEKFNIIYGSKDLTINNDFVKGVKTLDIIFAPTPSVGNFANDMVIPRIIKQNDNLIISPIGAKIRILYYGGVLSANGSWTYQSISGDSTETTYPYAGHLDHPFTPTVDLLFEKPETIYWGSAANIGTTYTDNNIFNIYHKQFIEEITDKDSKILIAYFRLRPIDIFQLDFKNFVHVDGINYRLNKIHDYNPQKEDVCKVELTKIKAGIPFVPGSGGIEGTGSNPVNFSIIEGGEDEVRDMAATSIYTSLDCGLNTVRPIGALGPHIVNGGKD